MSEIEQLRAQIVENAQAVLHEMTLRIAAMRERAAREALTAGILEETDSKTALYHRGRESAFNEIADLTEAVLMAGTDDRTNLRQ